MRPNHMRHGHRLKFIGWLIAFGTVALLIYGVIAGNTDSWPVAKDCTIVDSRVVRYYVAYGRENVLPLYRGEYDVRYTVNGREYDIWTFSGYMDKDQWFVKDLVRVSEQERCDFHIRYNPKNPQDALVTRQTSSAHSR